MPLFDIKQNKLTHISEESFKLEKEIQLLSEENLEAIFDLQFVKSEFSLSKFRIDTLAFDNKLNAFVIIEYKRDKSFSVIDQGYAYLSLMLNNKADFILEYNENNSKILKRDDVDWSQSRVMFVSPSFTTYQKEAINFKDLPIELWEIKRYSNQTVSYTQIRTSGTQESIKTISKQSETVNSVNKEIVVYSEEDHLSKATDDIKELYDKFKEAILSFDGIDIKPQKPYIAFIRNNSNVVDIVIQKNALKLTINLKIGSLDDPKNIARDVSNIGTWGNGDYEIKVSDDANIEYIMSLIKQSAVAK